MNSQHIRKGEKKMDFRKLRMALVLCLTGAAAFGQAPTEVPKESGEAAAAPKPATADAQAGVTGKGGGAFIKSEDGRSVIRFMGYAQPTFMATTKSQHQAFKSPTFYVRRARADFKAEYDSLYTLFFEYDAAPATGTSLIEAYTQAMLIKNRIYFRIGKYIQPFSAENLRSSRALETVERFQALNALVGLPGYDAQIGAMLWGNFDAGKMFHYFLSVNNGNSSASQGGNVRDNNWYKEVIPRLEFAPSKDMKFGIAGDLDREPFQPLVLKSYSGASFDSVRVEGQRVGLDVDAHVVLGKLGLDAEWLWANFPDTNATLQGGYLQGAYWACGSEVEGGMEPLLRLEYSQLAAKSASTEVDGSRMIAVTLGLNYWANQWVRWQTDFIEETTSGKGNGVYAGSSDGRFLPTLMSQLQIKF